MVLDNLAYFEEANKNKEELIDPNYQFIVERKVIPNTIYEDNELTRSNKKVIRFIQTLETNIFELKKDLNDPDIINILNLIICELKTKGMNYSAFCQYFNIHNMNYSIFKKLKKEDQIKFLKFIIKPYIENRHHLYLSHGYSNTVLQVMSDNYSHKRKGNYGSNKIADIMKILEVEDLAKMKNKQFNQECFYLLSDKNGKSLFKEFAISHNIRLSEEGKETEKYPDALIKIGDNFFIVEQKNMKENGGGQDKQTLEITEFIDKEPEINNLHYITFIDGIYFNQIDENATSKMHKQYVDILTVLSKRKQNYFVNSFAFKKLIEDYYNDIVSGKILKEITKQ